MLASNTVGEETDMSKANRSWLTVQKPTELPSGRGEYSKTYATGAGRFLKARILLPLYSWQRWPKRRVRFAMPSCFPAWR